MFAQTEELYLSILELARARAHTHTHYVCVCAKKAIRSDKDIFWP
jgi:hypothetical protein